MKDRNGKAFKRGDWVLVGTHDGCKALQVPNCFESGLPRGARHENMVALGLNEPAALREVLRLAGFEKVQGLFPTDAWRHHAAKDLVRFHGPQWFQYVYHSGGWAGNLSTVAHLLRRLHTQGLGVKFGGETRLVEVPS